MRKITETVTTAILNRQSRKVGNTHTDGNTLFLHGNAIARFNSDGNLEITNAGWATKTTKERLNALPGVSIYQKAGQWYLNGEPWNGEWTVIK